MNDLISRQTAIDALKEHRKLFCDNTPDTFSKLSYPEKCRVDELDTAIATLVNLPSVQPEIIRCRDCKHYYYADNRIPQEQRYVCDLDSDRWNFDDYCSYAERKTNG